MIDGNKVVWGWSSLWNDSWWQFDIVAEISDTLEGGDVLVNTIEVGSDDPEGVEIDGGNNTFDLPVTILSPKFEVGKTYESSMVAGTLVTYTLTVTNVGTETGTGVVLSDAVPVNLTYQGSDGTLTGGDVVWNLTSIAADGGTASGWFQGGLPCSGSVTNDDYRVVGSDQGVASSIGPAVTLAVVAPTLSPSFEQSSVTVDIGETVHFTDTSIWNGTDIVTWSWDFGDGQTGSGATTSHAYSAPGSYDVTLTITDTCGYSDSQTVVNAVSIAQNRTYLPIVVSNY
jgi:uncharacterized repeat protein (TIGR01451 family)